MKTRNRYLWAAATLLAASSGAVALANPPGAAADLPSQLLTRMRTTLEQVDTGQHQHAGHQVQQATTEDGEKPPVICGVRVYGHEPADATALADVRTVYGFHLCGIAEQKRPWDVAVKLAGPVILDLSADPARIQVVEATADTTYADRLRQMFPARYADLATREALTAGEMADVRRRYESAAGL